MIGRAISHYRVTEKLGEGGMGVVYKAEDTKLKRPVALKFLAAHLLNDEEIKARFQREAESAAALTHANIAVIYEIDESDGHSFIAMEFIEGPTVGEKVSERPLKLEEALDIAIQAAQGLHIAHERGIVHRDIKSANLMVTLQGQVKIMDFGLAQLAERSKLTETTTILGTPAYMSPEQAVGAKTDRRTDLWSLGVVLYEMVAGRLPFAGERQEAVLYGITNEEPEPVTALRAGLPMELEWIIGKALAKNREERYQHAEDLLVDLRGLHKKLASGKSTIMQAAVATGTHAGLTQPPGQAESPSLPGPLAKYRVIEDIKESDDTVKYLAEDTELHRSVAIRVLPQSSAEQLERAQRRKLVLALGAGALGVLLALVFAFFPLFAPAPVAEARVWRFSISPDNLTPFNRASGGISPDGKYVIYRTATEGERALWLRPLDSETPRKLEGTEGALSGNWSPDSKSIVFGTDRELKRVSIDGGTSITLCQLPATGYAFLGASESPDGSRIVFSSGVKLYEIAARGGEPKLLFEPDESEGMRYFLAPHFLPSGGVSAGLLYTAASTADDFRVWLLDFKTGEHRELTPGAGAVYSKSGHLIYHPGNDTDTGLRALPFSVENLALNGEAFPIEESGHRASIAADGTLAYYDSGTTGSPLPKQLVWTDRSGTTLSTIGQPQVGLRDPSLSPDGHRVAVRAVEDGNQDIWLHEVNRPVKTRLTFDESQDAVPRWLPSGDAISFASDRSGDRELYSRRADGNSPAEPLLNPDPSVRRLLTDWSDDARLALYYERPASEIGVHDLWYLERRDDGSGYEAVPFLQTPFSEAAAAFSPDEKWVAYVSNESGRYEVYVRSFPDGGGKQQVSVNGGGGPRWSQAGEIFYVADSTLIAVPVSTGPTLAVGQPLPLFSSQQLGFGGRTPTYDVTPDGQQIVLREVAETEASTEAESGDQPRPSIHIVRNWYEEFRNREQN